jgi:hypothetical protein
LRREGTQLLIDLVIDALHGLKMSDPKATRARRSELRVIREHLAGKPA